MTYSEAYERLMGSPTDARCDRAALFPCALVARHEGACINKPLPSPTAALEDGADLGIGPNVRCAATIPMPLIRGLGLLARLYARGVPPEEASVPCEISPADGHTYHHALGAMFGWEGHP